MRGPPILLKVPGIAGVDLRCGERAASLARGCWGVVAKGGTTKRQGAALSLGDGQNQGALTIKTRVNNAGGAARRSRGCIISLCVPSALLLSSGAAASPMDLSGSVGYGYTSLDSKLSHSTDNELLGVLRASSYIWQPWFATAEGGVTLTQDSANLTDNSDGYYSTNTSSQILSGDLVLNILPQSQTPFRLSYQSTDSRVDNGANAPAGNPIIRLAGDNYKTTALDVRQSYITDAGSRIQASYGDRTWTSDIDGTYQDQIAGVELDYRPAGQRLLARANVENVDQSQTDRHQNNEIVDINHYYYPTDDLRIDSTASLYNLNTNFAGSAGLVDTMVNNITQASSFAFWRPSDQRWTVSGGVRVMDMKGSDTAQSSNQSSVGATAGAFYQYSQRLRFDSSFSYTGADVTGANQNSAQEHLGSTYQSDLIDIKGYTYSWFSTAAVDNQSDPGMNQQSLSLSLGHDAQKMWWQGDGASIRLSFNQSVNEILMSGALPQIPCSDLQCQSQFPGSALQTNGSDATLDLDDSVTLGWNQSGQNGTTLVQLTLTDSRDLTGIAGNQQLVNFQASRVQNISRNSTLSGDITLQTVTRGFSGQPNNGTVTSGTGQVTYQHMRLFGIPSLQFESDLMLSQASTSEGANRDEWGNSLNYTIGMVDVSLSYRILNDSINDSRLLYFRVMRRF